METKGSDIARCPSHLFVELTSLDELSFPASTSKRLKFTCVCASPRNLVLGTSSGTVYVFARFRQKGRGNSVPPVDVFTTKDGPVHTVQVSPDEQYVAVGSDSGRISIAIFAAHGAKTSIVYTTPGDPRKPDKVTTLCWSHDGKQIFAGFASGSLQVHQLSQSMFRSSSKQLCTFDSEIGQMDISHSGKQLLVSTISASFIYDLENRITNQVGKKARNSSLGACFLTSTDDPSNCEFVVAARPNGRIWEANCVGVVYKTHQLRQSTTIPRFSSVSYRTSFRGSQEDMEASEGLETAVNMDIQFSVLNQLVTGRPTSIVSHHGSRLIVCDVETSSVILVTDLKKEILQISVCGSDVFTLLSSPTNSPSFHKFSFLSLESAVDKLMTRSSYIQAAEIVTKIPSFNWETRALTAILDGISALKKKDKKVESLRTDVGKLLDQRAVNESTYDNCAPKNREVPGVPSSTRLSSGVHRVLCQPGSSGVEDDFSFRFSSSLRERSHSSPSVDTKNSICNSAAVTKQNSMPLTAEEVDECSRNGTPDVTRQDILERAKHILESDGHVVGADSLRTLLQLECQSPADLRFTPTITVNNAAKALAELAVVTPLDVASILSVDRRVNASGTRRTGPTIVKPVRRQVVRPTAAPVEPAIVKEVEKNDSECIDNTMEANSNIIEEENSPKDGWSDNQNNPEADEEWLLQRMQQLKIRESKCSSVPSTSSESESVTTTELSNEAKGSEKSADDEHCSQCGIHRSWLGLALLAVVCRRVVVSRSTKSKDCVPSTSSDWSHILRTRLNLPDEPGRLCPHCENILAGASKTLASLSTSTGLAPPDQRLGVEEIRERIKEGGKSRMKIILGCEEEEPSPIRSPPVVSPLSPVPNGVLHSPSKEISPSSLSENFDYGSLLWLPGVDFRTLLFFGCVVLGHRSLLVVIKEDPALADLLHTSHWSTLSALAIREQQMKKDLVGPTVIREVLDSVNLSLFLSAPSASTENSPSPRASLSRRSAPPPIYSWIIDTNGACLICTLPLQTEIKGSELEITTHNCGHTYHSKCVTGKPYCVACRVRARKMAAAAASRTAPSRPKK